MSETMAGQPEAPCFRFERGQDETIVHMPMNRSFSHIIKIVLLAMVMLLGGGFAWVLSIAGSREPLFYTVWLSLWAVAMTGLTFYLVYTLFGADRLIIRRDGVSRVRSIFGIPFRQNFTPAEARAFTFTNRDKTIRYKAGPTPIATSALVLANRDRYVSIARGITALEAEAIMAAVRARVGSWEHSR